MSEQLDKKFSKVEDQILGSKNTQRPNIDLLIKRIMTQRRQDKKNFIITIFSIFVGIAIIFFLYIKN